MKNSPPSKPARMSLAEADRLARRDRMRIIVMGVGVILLGGSYFVSRMVQSRYAEKDALEQPAIQPPAQEENVVFVEFDMPEVLEGIRDATPEQRVLIRDQESLTKVLDYGRLFSESQYRAMGVRDLDAEPEAFAELEADPAAHRVEPFRARGEVLAIAENKRDKGYVPEKHGTLRTESGHDVHFIVTEAPEDVQPGSWVRLDGVFYKMRRDEVAGEWRDGPLLLGREAVTAYPRAELADDLTVAGLDELTDDTFESTTPIPPQVEWGLMAKALEAGDRVDWESAPELNAELLNAIFQDGTPYRGKPFRFPVSRNVGSWVERQGENSLHLDEFTVGWIGNFTWKGAVGAVRFSAPFSKPELQDWEETARYVTARGYFVKNVNYEQNNGKPGRVPHFVLDSVEIFTPELDGSTTTLMWGILGATIALILLFWFLLANDKKNSQKLQEELVRRRRARRERGATGNKLDLAAQAPDAGA